MIEIQTGASDQRQRHLRAGRWSEALACYAVTKCTESRRKVLAAHDAAAIVLSCLQFQRRHDRIRLLSFCIMPDHYHVLFFLLPGRTLSQVMSSIGKFTATELNKLHRRKGKLWQEGFFDHRCRDEDDIIDRLTYFENNPVRAGLTDRPEQWPYSSAHPSAKAMLDRDWYNDVR